MPGLCVALKNRFEKWFCEGMLSSRESHPALRPTKLHPLLLVSPTCAGPRLGAEAAWTDTAFHPLGWAIFIPHRHSAAPGSSGDPGVYSPVGAGRAGSAARFCCAPHQMPGTASAGVPAAQAKVSVINGEAAHFRCVCPGGQNPQDGQLGGWALADQLSFLCLFIHE